MFKDSRNEKAEAYQILAQFFLQPPDEESLDAIRQDFSLDSRETLDEITKDFYGLFPYPHGRLQPRESLCVPLTGTGYADVRDAYKGAGLAIDESYEVAPDHLSLELLFMSHLIMNSETEMEQNFLEQHLLNWVPYYCDEVIKQSKTLFYREIAEIVKDFLVSEHDGYTR